jgi:hypothetical protein
MLTVYSTTPDPSDKPQKPYPEFPPFSHAIKCRAKKTRANFSDYQMTNSALSPIAWPTALLNTARSR